MKKIFYGLSLLCLMFFGISNVMASGSVDVSILALQIEEGSTETFYMLVDNAIARANINSSDTSVATVSPEGSWISPMDGAGKNQRIPFTVTAVGAVGTKTTVVVEIYDASTFDSTPVRLASSTNKIIRNVAIEVVADKGTTVVPQPQPQPQTYTISYDANGGTGAPKVQTKQENVELVLDATKPVKDKYTFVEWNTKKDGSGQSYVPGGKYTANANVTLYAQWKSSVNVDKNPQTGDSSIFIIIAIVVTFGGYAFWYTKKAKEN